eukprot:SAG11_NODE_806_length_7093_cov_1.965379_10_plen_82_part_00
MLAARNRCEAKERSNRQGTRRQPRLKEDLQSARDKVHQSAACPEAEVQRQPVSETMQMYTERVETGAATICDSLRPPTIGG